jgi:F0F1-type ATP synthase membrane subunit b/b'
MSPRESDALSGPWYAKLAESILRTSGPMALLTVAFSWFVMWIVWGSLQTIKDTQLLIRNDIAQAGARMTAFAAQQDQFNEGRSILLEKQLAILRQLCVNSSRTEAAIKACVQ